ncbi:amidase [Nonomuraea sp. NPDC048916]|uniref:amidase n=1 Tax=Nonomuraea sp. NPDC048916 TaxID=3154232 RepID=UPI0034040576
MSSGTGAPLSGDLLRDLDERLCRLGLGELGLPGALYQGDPPYEATPVPTGEPHDRTAPYGAAQVPTGEPHDRTAPYGAAQVTTGEPGGRTAPYGTTPVPTGEPGGRTAPYGAAPVTTGEPHDRTAPYRRAGGEDESVLGMGAALRDGRLSPADLLDRTLERIAGSDGEIRAWARVDTDGARAAAERLMAERSLSGHATTGHAAAERDPAEPGWAGRPLHGIPVGVKDLIDVAGVPTGGGSRHLSGPGRERLPAADAGCVARLRAAGAVIVGKTTTHEYAFGGTTPPTRNPHDTARIPGGSSGGSAAAVAAGHVRVAFGSDTAGSVRIPSSYCGTVGLVPSPGRLPGDGVLPLAWSLDRVGLITASVEDLALSAYALGISPLIDLDGPATFEGVRVGVPAGALDEPIDPEVGEAVESAFAAVRALGGEIVEVEIPHGWAAVAAGMTIILAECLDYHRERRRDGGDELFGADVRAMLDLAERVPAGAYVRAQRLRHALRAEALAALSGVDVLAMPTMPCVAPRIDAVGEGTLPVGGAQVSIAEAHLRYNVLANLAALPCATQPVGVGSAALPVGLQWVAAPGDDERLITSMNSLARHGR